MTDTAPTASSTQRAVGIVLLLAAGLVSLPQARHQGGLAAGSRTHRRGSR